METLQPEQLREPLVALYYGHFLAGNDQAEKATPFLALAETTAFLPEERAFLAPAKPKVPAPAAPPSARDGK